MAKLTIIGMYNYDDSLFDGLTFPAGINKDIAVHEILIRSGEFETIYPSLDFLKMQIEHWGKKHYRTFEKWIDALNIEFEPLYNYDRYEEYTDVHSGSGEQKDTSSDRENIIGMSSREHEESGEHGSNSSTVSANENKEKKTGSGLSVSSTDTVNTNDVTVDRNVAAYDSATLQPKEQEITDGDSTSSGNGISNTANKEESENVANSLSNTETNETNSANTIESESNINNLNRQNDRTLEHKSDDVTRHNAHLYGNIGVTTSTQMLEDYLRVERFNIYEQIADIFADEFCIMVY